MNELNNIIIGYSYEWTPKSNKNYNNKEIKKIKDEDIKLKHIKEAEKNKAEVGNLQSRLINGEKITLNIISCGLCNYNCEKCMGIK